jgi:hypothetical protein
MTTFTCLFILQSAVLGQTTDELQDRAPESYDFEMYQASNPYLLRIAWNGSSYAKELRIVGVRDEKQKVLIHLKNNVTLAEDYLPVSYVMLPHGYSGYRLELLQRGDSGTQQMVRGIDAIERPALRNIVENFRDPVDFARLVRMVQDNSTRITYSGTPQKYFEGSVEDVILKNKHGHCSHFCYLLQQDLARKGYVSTTFGMSMSYANHAIVDVELPASRVFTPTSLCVDGNLGILYYRSVQDIFATPRLADEFLVGSSIKRKFWRYYGSRFFAMKTKAITVVSRDQMESNLKIIIDRNREKNSHWHRKSLTSHLEFGQCRSLANE